MSDVFINEVLGHALRAAGPMDDVDSWRGKISVLIPEIVAIFGEHSREYEQVKHMTESPAIIGELLDVEYQERSTRTKVTIRADRGRKESEHFWSERADTPLGQHQRKLLASLKPGQRVLVWKSTRPAESNDEIKVRHLAHIRVLSTDAEHNESAAPAQTGVPPPAPTQAQPASPGGSPIPPGGATTSRLPNPSVHAAYEALPGPQRVKLARWGMDNGINNLFDPDLPDDKVQAILAHCELIQQGMA